LEQERNKKKKKNKRKRREISRIKENELKKERRNFIDESSTNG